MKTNENRLKSRVNKLKYLSIECPKCKKGDVVILGDFFNEENDPFKLCKKEVAKCTYYTGDRIKTTIYFKKTGDIADVYSNPLLDQIVNIVKVKRTKYIF